MYRNDAYAIMWGCGYKTDLPDNGKDERDVIYWDVVPAIGSSAKRSNGIEVKA